MNRIPFGQECLLPVRHFDSCPCCGSGKGRLHEPGCGLEECPECCDPVVRCQCDVLSLVDQAIVMKAIAATFTSCLDAMEAATKDIEDQSLAVRGAWLAAWRLAPPEVRAKLSEGLAKCLPSWRADFCDDTGKGFMSAAAVAEGLGKPLEEVQAVVKVIGDLGEPPVGQLHRVH